MIDWLYILVLLLSAMLLVLQELVIRKQNKLIDMQHKLLGECEPIIAAVVKAVEEAKANGSNKAKVEL